jgi:hypothetical protein
MVRKRSAHPTPTTIATDDSPMTLTLEEENAFAELRSTLAEINKIPGVKGYILRNSTTAVIDLQNTEKLIQYALLFSETVDCIQEISQLFSLNITNVVLEGKEIKILCMIEGNNNLCILVEKNVDYADIFRRISN